jgi:hypothetical protein
LKPRRSSGHGSRRIQKFKDFFGRRFELGCKAIKPRLVRGKPVNRGFHLVVNVKRYTSGRFLALPELLV